MRKVVGLWWDKETNRVEARFDDGGVSIPILGTRALDLASAFFDAAERIHALERDIPYPPPFVKQGEFANDCTKG